VADEHTPHRFVVSAILDLPFGRGRTWLSKLPAWSEALFGGWTLAAIATLASGQPVNMSVQGNPSNTGNPDRPDVVGDWHLTESQPSLERWFNLGGCHWHHTVKPRSQLPADSAERSRYGKLRS